MLFPKWSRLVSRQIHRSRRPHDVSSVELLERRTVPTVTLSGTSEVVITITRDESVSVTDDADANGDGFVNLQLVVNGENRIYDGETVSDDGEVYPFVDANFVESLTIRATSSSSANIIDLRGLSGDAYVLLSGVTVKAGGGNDTVFGSDLDTFNEVIFGGRGNDILIGGGGDDILIGEDGDDSIVGGDGEDNLQGGNGNDVLGAQTIEVDVDGDGTPESTDFTEDGNDNIKGQRGNDRIDGGDGDDRIDGFDGNDTLIGGDGSDSILGGSGNDIIRGDAGNGAEEGNDTIDGGSGVDVISGNGGDDSINGGDGNDIIGGGDGDDVINGGNGNDRLFGDLGNDTVNGGAGNDTILGGNGNDSLVGGAGNDVMAGQDGIDTVNGQGGTDVLVGGSGGPDGAEDPGDLVIGSSSEQNETSTLVTGARIGWTALVTDN